MTEKRIRVWIQPFRDRPYPMLRWLDPDSGRRKSQSAGTAQPKAVETARADLEADLNHGRHKAASRLSWIRFRELFEAEYASATRPDTQKNFATTFDHLETLCHPTSLQAVNTRLLSTFAAHLRKQKGQGGTLKPSSIKVILQFLRTALNWATKQKLIPECPAFPTIKVPRSKPQPVPTEAVEKLLDKAPDEPMRTFLLSGWLAGLRLNEALALEWEETDRAPWVDMDRNRIWLPAGFVKAVEDQWVPLDPELKIALANLPITGKRVFHFTATDSHPITDSSLCCRIRRLAHDAGVRLTMKSLRRGFGCRYASRVPAQVLQKLMRHSNIRITMDYYANVDDAVEQAVLGARQAGEPRIQNPEGEGYRTPQRLLPSAPELAPGDSRGGNASTQGRECDSRGRPVLQGQGDGAIHPPACSTPSACTTPPSQGGRKSNRRGAEAFQTQPRPRTQRTAQNASGTPRRGIGRLKASGRLGAQQKRSGLREISDCPSERDEPATPEHGPRPPAHRPRNDLRNRKATGPVAQAVDGDVSPSQERELR
jgi:integrase